MQYLQEKQHYIDLYDLLTVKRCLDFSKRLAETSRKKSKDPRIIAKKMVRDVSLYFIKGEEYQNKSETIENWMRRDEEKDEKVKNAAPKESINCDFCYGKMDFTSKELHHDGLRVMFWYECPRCKKRRLIFDTGEEYKHKPRLCPKCSCEVEETSKRKGEVITTTIKCPNCEYKSKEIIDFEKDNKEWKEKQRQDAELLKRYRGQFCLSEKEGSEYIQSVEQTKLFTERLKEREIKEANPAYQKAKKLKTLKVLQLKALIQTTVEKEGYINLQFEKPEMGKFVIVGFTVNDSKEEREEYDSCQNIKKLINKTLEQTNWRLMSEGISYRLGILSGRLKAYEREDDLMRLVK